MGLGITRVTSRANMPPSISFCAALPFSVTKRDDEDEMDFPRSDEPLAVLLERELTNRYGPIVSNDNLRLVLGYASKAAFRQALSRKTLPIAVFEIEKRRGKFALIRDVAMWLAAQRERAVTGTQSAPPCPAATDPDNNTSRGGHI